MAKRFHYRSMTPLVIASVFLSVLVVPGFLQAETRPAEKAEKVEKVKEAQQNAFQQQVKAQANEAAATVARNAIEKATQTLQRFVASARTKVVGMKDVANADRSRLATALDAETARLAEQASGLSDAPLSILKQRAAAINSRKGQIKAVVQRVLGELQALRLQVTAERLQKQNTRSQKLVGLLVQRGAASQELQDTAANYSAAATRTVEQSKQNVQFFQALSATSASDAAYKAGTAQLAATRVQIKQANAQLQSLTALLKTAVGSN